MRVVFDGRYAHSDRPDGVGRYSIGLANELGRLVPIRVLICHESQKSLYSSAQSFILGPHPESVGEFMAAAAIERAGGADVVFSPLQTIGAFRRQFRLIITIYDLTHFAHRSVPSHLRWRTRWLWWIYHSSLAPQRWLMNRADGVVTVSHASRDAIDRARLFDQEVIVVPPGRADEVVRPVDQSAGIPINLIYMGELTPHKNPETLIDGMKYLPGRTLHLLSRGTPSRIRNLRAKVPPGTQVVFHNGVTDQEYRELLHDRALLVTASLGEGFCLPLVEALEIGVPCVASDLPAIRETAGPGAVYFTPRSATEFANAVRQLDSPKERSRLARDGWAHIARFDWNSSAKLLLAEVERVASASSSGGRASAREQQRF